MSSQITLAALRLGAEEGVGRTREKKKNIKPITEPTPKAVEAPKPRKTENYQVRRCES